MAIPWEIGTTLTMEPHAGDPRKSALAMRGAIVDVPGGARIVDTDPAMPNARHEFAFAAVNHSERAFLESFFDARQGKAEAFWFPTWQWELDVRGYELPNAGSYHLYIERWGYVEQFFPLGAQYRQILILQGDRWAAHTVDAVLASYAPGIDRLHMTLGSSSIPAPTFTPAVTLRTDAYRPLWLRYGRFDQDELVAELLNGDGACQIALAMVETPEEIA